MQLAPQPGRFDRAILAIAFVAVAAALAALLAGCLSPEQIDQFREAKAHADEEVALLRQDAANIREAIELMPEGEVRDRMVADLKKSEKLLAGAQAASQELDRLIVAAETGELEPGTVEGLTRGTPLEPWGAALGGIAAAIFAAVQSRRRSRDLKVATHELRAKQEAAEAALRQWFHEGEPGTTPALELAAEDLGIDPRTLDAQPRRAGRVTLAQFN